MADTVILQRDTLWVNLEGEESLLDTVEARRSELNLDASV